MTVPGADSTDVLAQIRDELAGLRSDLSAARGRTPPDGDGSRVLQEPGRRRTRDRMTERMRARDTKPLP